MRIICVQFDFEERGEIYAPLLEVFRRSCAAHMPDVTFEAIRVPPPKIKEGVTRGFSTNTAKLAIWAKAVAESQEPLLLSDCDMLCLRDLRDVWDKDFDIAYTVRSGCRLPFNSGVVFVKATDAARKFVAEWRDVNDRMFSNSTLHSPYRTKYSGMNQAAFGYLLERRTVPHAKIIALPCKEWNCCNEDWEKVDLKTTRLVHFKGSLRAAALQPGSVPPSAVATLVKEWKRYAVA